MRLASRAFEVFEELAETGFESAGGALPSPAMFGAALVALTVGASVEAAADGEEEAEGEDGPGPSGGVAVGVGEVDRLGGEQAEEDGEGGGDGFEGPDVDAEAKVGTVQFELRS